MDFNNEQYPWHSLNINEVFAKLASNEDGLSAPEVKKRQVIYGINQIAAQTHDNIAIRLLRQFNNVLIYILLFSSVVTTFLRRFVDTCVILIVIILNALFGFFQEGKAKKALDAIRKMLAPTANVIRGGERSSIKAVDLVPGDIVLIQSGDKIPADLRIIESKNLQIQESALTGESIATEKFDQEIAESTPLAERSSMAYDGTIVIYGRGTGIVVATGIHTEIGKISASLSEQPKITTPLIRKLDNFAWWLSFAIIIMAIGTFLIGTLFWGYASDEMFMAIVGLTVAAIPEGLPPIMTIILAIGVTRMAKHNAIIRHLPAVETMGSVTTICTDKTGTLTCNELAVQSIVTNQNKYHVSGGATLIGEFSISDEVIKPQDYADLVAALRGAVLCNETEIIQTQKNSWQTSSDPLDNAMLMLAQKANIDIALESKNYPRTDMIPYESQHKLMATLHHNHTNKAYIFIKGAAEKILEICSYQQNNSEKEPINFDYWNEHINQLAASGQKVIAIAYKPVPITKQNLNFDDIDNGLIFLTLFGIIDPPRAEVADAVFECRQAGIQVKMITGDHAATAEAIAVALGIDNTYGVITGSEIDAMEESKLRELACKIDIYARTSPEHKLRLVKALQAKNEIVAMTGDGVNDAPALKQANIGIAMGKKGTEIAKEASAMVLADDNFATLVHAVEEGRTVYNNLKKAILYILPTSFAQAFIVMFAILLGIQTPLTAVQILWINMITAVTLSLALGFEPSNPEIVMSAPPHSVNEPMLSPLLVWRTAFVSLLIILCAFGLSEIERRIGADLETIRTAVVNMVVAGEIAYLINCRNIYTSIFNKKALFGSKPMLIAIGAVVVLQLLFTYMPTMQFFFQTKAIDLMQWARIGVCAIGILLLVELEKFIMRFLRFVKKGNSSSGYC